MYASGPELRLLDSFSLSVSLYFFLPCLSQTRASPGSILTGTGAGVRALDPLGRLHSSPWQAGHGASTPCPLPTRLSRGLGSGKSAPSTHVQSFP